LFEELQRQVEEHAGRVASACVQHAMDGITALHGRAATLLTEVEALSERIRAAEWIAGAAQKAFDVLSPLLDSMDASDAVILAAAMTPPALGLATTSFPRSTRATPRRQPQPRRSSFCHSAGLAARRPRFPWATSITSTSKDT